MNNYINPFAFFISIFIGFLIVYITTPIPDIVLKYPTPENSDRITYEDKGSCYKYKAKEVSCELKK